MNDAESRIRSELRDAVEEYSAVPSSCPWCEYRRWDPRHATKAHPEEWAEWKFDCEMLEHAGEQVGVPMPWEFYQERDVRTLDALPVDVEIEQQGVEHTALDDAIYQARVASTILHKVSDNGGSK